MITHLDTAWVAGPFSTEGPGISAYFTFFTAEPRSSGREVVATIALSTLECEYAIADIASYRPPFGPPVDFGYFQNAVRAPKAISVTFRLVAYKGLADAQANVFYFD